MRPPLRPSLLALSLCVAPLSCGGAADPTAAREALCDGSAVLRLRVALEGGGLEFQGSNVRTDHGFQAFVVDSNCSFWMNGGWQLNDPLARDRGWRTGTLDQTSVTALQTALPLADLGTLGDCAGQGLPDAPSRIIYTARSKAGCAASGARFDAAWTAITSVATQLWPHATPMKGPIRVSALGADSPPGAHAPYPWPLPSLQPFLLAPGPADGGEYPNTLVTDLAAAGKLRALRDRYLADRSVPGGGFSNWDGLITTDGATSAVTFMRDALPYEDQRGRFPF